MSPFLVAVLILYGLAALGLAAWAALNRGERLAARVSRRVGLALPAEPLRQKIVHRIRRTTRWTAGGGAVGALLGIAACVAVTLNGVLPPGDTGLVWLAFAGLLLGTSVGAVLAVLTERRGDVPAERRVARATPRRLGDYLDPLELVGARIVAALGAATAIGMLVWPEARSASEPAPFTVALLAAAGVVALAVLEIAGRRIVLGRSRVAESDAELAWDDALRADDLRRLVTAVLMTGLYAVIFGVFPLLGAAASDLLPREALLIAVNVTMYLLLGALITIAIIAGTRSPGRYYLRRLWPEVAAQARAAANR